MHCFLVNCIHLGLSMKNDGENTLHSTQQALLKFEYCRRIHMFEQSGSNNLYFWSHKFFQEIKDKTYTFAI